MSSVAKCRYCGAEIVFIHGLIPPRTVPIEAEGFEVGDKYLNASKHQPHRCKRHKKEDPLKKSLQ